MIACPRLPRDWREGVFTARGLARRSGQAARTVLASSAPGGALAARPPDAAECGDMRVQQPSAYRVYLGLSAAQYLLFSMLSTVSGVYAVKAAQLNPLQLVLVGTTLEAIAFVLQVPTGVIADVYGRRLSVLLGLFLTGIGFLIWGAFARFETILLAQLFYGAGFTCISGAEEAWIAGEIGDASAGHAFLRGTQAAQLGGIAGIVLSVTLASVRLSLPLLVAGVLFLVLGAAMVVLMPEHGFRPPPKGERTSWQQWSGTLRSGVHAVRGRPVLITILAITAILGASSEGFDRLKEAHVLLNVGLPALGSFDPVVWFGVIAGGGMLISVVVAEVLRRRLDTTSHRAVARTLLAVSALLSLTVIVFGLSGNFALALATWWAVTLLRRLNTPLVTAWLNQHIEPGLRATLFSLNNQADALGQIGGGPLLGAAAAGVSIPAGIVLAGLFILPALPLYARSLRQGAGDLEAVTA